MSTPTNKDSLLGSGEWTYRMVTDWAKLPDGWEMGDVAAVTVDRRDHVYVFVRFTEHPLMVFDRDGNFLRSWGEGGMFKNPHGLSYAEDDHIYCTDDRNHTVRKFTPEGKLVLEIGIPDQPAPRLSGQPFNRCTHTALSPGGDIFVSDGYGNARVHKYSPDGKLLKSWGEFGSGPGEFNLPHNITSDPDGWLYVADRENNRVQVFDLEGRFETQWNNLHRPCALCTQQQKQPLSFIAEAGPGLSVNLDYPNLGPRLSIVNHRGKVLARIGDKSGAGEEAERFRAPHGIAIDSRHDIYVAELGGMYWKARWPNQQMPPPSQLANLKKLVRVPA